MIGEAFIRVRPDTTTFGAQTKLGVAAGLRGAGLGAAAAGVGLTGVAAAALAVGAALNVSLHSAADLQVGLATFDVAAEATDAQMEQVADTARRLGADLLLPNVSAGDAANAMAQLAKGGLSVKDALESARGTLQLAAAAEISVGEAADFTARALSAFELPGSQAATVANLLAGASLAATGEVTDMAQALQQSAAVAHSAGIPIETLVGMITLLAKNGILGSDAGTSIRTTLLRLIPTSQEAADVVKALGIEVADSAGNIRSVEDIFEQYRVALAKLTPVTRQQALATIFGTDAIRAATIFQKAGAKGIEETTKQAQRANAAQDLAKAKTIGLTGAFGGLKSTAETLAATVGQILSPAVVTLVSDLASVVGAVNTTIGSLTDLSNTRVGGAVLEGLKSSLPGVRQIKDLKLVVGLAKRLKGLVSGGDGLTGDESAPGHSAADASGRAIKKQLAKVKADAAGEGVDTGEAYALSVSKGIIANAREGVAAAHRMLADVVRAGNEAIEAAASGAKSNLTALGDELGTMAAQVIDNGPLGRQIKRLQESLNVSSTKGEKNRLGRELRDAGKELADAKKQIGTAAGRTPEQQKAVDEFLRPFVEKVKDAQAALGEFNTEGVIATLQKAAEKQKETVTRGISDVIAAFNAGRIGADEANRRIAATLAGARGAYKAAGATLGAAFKDDFIAQVRGLGKQIDEIVNGPKTTKRGNEPDITSPSQVASDVGRSVADAQRGVADAQRNLADTAKAQLHEDEESTQLLREIRDQNAGRPTTSKRQRAAVSSGFSDKRGGR